MTAKTKPADHFDNPDAFEGFNWTDAETVQGDSFGEVVPFDDPGMVFVGRYEGSEDVTIGEGEDEATVKAHRFLDGYAVKLTVWGSYDLDGKIAEISAGTLVRIEYLKKLSLKGGREMRLYKVQTA